MPNRKYFLFILVVIFLLSGCGWWKDFGKQQERSRATPEGLYQLGVDAYNRGRYERAIESFQRMKEEYPLHQLAIMAELGVADSYFSDKQYIDAEIAYNDFLNLHPTNENLPYVMYQLGMCHYNQMIELDRDQAETQKAQKEFEQLIARFPSSKFSFMAEKMLQECKKRLAEHEFYVGYFYYHMKQYKAALKRFQVINEHYKNLGLDYKVGYFLAETKKKLAESGVATEQYIVPRSGPSSPWF